MGADKVSIAKFKRLRSLGRTKSKWEDNIEIDVKRRL
jgi:hypothetical protein